ncbi:DNA polymerase III subunit gamma/tau [Candidatus Gracilibacteria bacterium]|nr:DNA polymerase III subunit gamma/tau [Candidatus Gracilibacteria bacterium]
MTLYLKYRPIDFDNLVGQEFINSTLQRAIADDKLVGAYLFCGPRGTGKTSTARLLAKTMNCPNQKNGKPCLKCDICRDFLEEKLIDIIEIDAASHTGVDNIREIIEKAQFAPTHTKYKVYIIDEVHMLSKGAFNALLKILEEPPAHVKFILATTETHKVPETIISRCQRYDFKRISSKDITKRVQYIAEQENISIDEASLDYIVKNSGGGLRNALTLFEQLIEGNAITYENVIQKLGIVDDDILENFYNKLIQEDKTIIEDFESIISDGKNVVLFMKELIFFTKEKMITETKSGNNITSHISIIDTLNTAFIQSKNALDEHTTFLVALLKITSSFSTPPSPLQEGGLKNEKQKNNNPTSSPELGISEIPLKREEVKDIKKEAKKELPRELTEELANIDDAEELFDNTDIEIKPETQELASFDSAGFIDKLKSKGAKGGLTMALRGSTLALSGSTLSITASTSIARNQITNADNKALMLEVLQNMGYNDISLSIS